MKKVIYLFISFMFNFLIVKSQINIGNQTWTSQNCVVSTYRNGDPIPKVEDPIIWKNLTTGAWCWYNNDSVNYSQYGKLYNWYAVSDIRGLAPVGWHIPSNAEWNILANYLDLNSDTSCSICPQSASAGGALKETGTVRWFSPNTGATNSSGFTALPGGYRGINGNFGFIKNLGYWWSSDESDQLNAWGRLLTSDAAVLFRSYYDKVDGFSVRLIKECTQITVPVFTQLSPVCLGGTFNLPTISNNGITGTWSPAINNQTTTTYTFTPNPGQCASITTMIVTVNSTPIVPSFNQISAICKGATLALPSTSNNGISGVWSPAINNQVTTNYTFTPTAGQCASSASMIVTVNPLPAEPAVTSPVNKCFGDPSSTLTATGTGLLWYYSASGGSGSTAAPIASTSTVGNTTYYVTQTINGCESNPRSAIVVSVSQPVVNAGGPLNVYPGSSTPITAIYSGNNSSALASVLWTPSSDCNPSNQLSTVITPSALSGTVNYQITVTDNKGCSATDNLEVNIIDKCIKVTNAFSPNGDGINDYWVVYEGVSCLRQVNVKVFNRYGSQVYENIDYQNNWGGTYKGNPIPDGTYYAVIEFTLIDGKKINTRTDITILR